MHLFDCQFGFADPAIPPPPGIAVHEPTKTGVLNRIQLRNLSVHLSQNLPRLIGASIANEDAPQWMRCLLPDPDASTTAERSESSSGVVVR